jgi:phage repressor protein C with HTH and peptisase S24 domain
MRQHDRPLTHAWIWMAIDTLAARHGLSPSGLARLAGLDPTTFNRSKRLTSEGRPRWPSTESIAKVLAATRTSLDDFASIDLEEDATTPGRADEDLLGDVPIVGEIRNASVAGWEPPPMETGPAPPADRRFALAVADRSLEPVYGRGHLLVVSEAADRRPGDRVIVKQSGMSAAPGILISSSERIVELGGLRGDGKARQVPSQDIDWMGRIVLVRQ